MGTINRGLRGMVREDHSQKCSPRKDQFIAITAVHESA